MYLTFNTFWGCANFFTQMVCTPCEVGADVTWHLQMGKADQEGLRDPPEVSQLGPLGFRPHRSNVRNLSIRVSYTIVEEYSRHLALKHQHILCWDSIVWQLRTVIFSVNKLPRDIVPLRYSGLEFSVTA